MDKYEKAREKALSQLAALAARREEGQGSAYYPAPQAPSHEPQNGMRSQTMPGSAHIARNCLNGGEISPQMDSRFDQQRYASGCHCLLNMVPLPCGGITKRPGMRFLDWAKARDGAQTLRLIPFVFSANESRMLEIYGIAQDKCGMRVWSAEGEVIKDDACILPFGPQEARTLNYCQSADVVFLAHHKINPGKIMRHADDDWRYETIDWSPGIEAPQWDWCGPRGSSNDNRRVTVEYVCTAIDAETGAESLPSRPWVLNGQYPLTESRYIEIRPRIVAGAAEYKIYKKSAGVYGYIGSISQPENLPGPDYTGESPLKFDDTGFAPDTEDTPPDARDPFAEEDCKPSVVFLHQQRLGFAASKKRPLTVWLSQSGNFESMAASVPPNDDDAIEATLAATQANAILWAISDRSGLALGTEGGEWMLAPAEGAAITPKDLSFQPQTSWGSQPGLEPARAASGIVFAQRGGRVVRDFGYSFSDDRYNASDISILARHMLKDSPIVSWAWQQEPYGILWAALANGKMAALTCLREHEVLAWHRHETDGHVEALATIPAGDGNHALFLAVLRDGRRSIEMLEPFADADANTSHVDGPFKAQYRARCVPCLPEINDDSGSSFLAIRKINSVKARVLNSKPFKIRVNGQNARASSLANVPARPAGFVAEAIWDCPTGAGWRENARLEIVADGPDPLTITGLNISIEIADANGGQK